MARNIVPKSLREPQDESIENIFNKVAQYPGEKSGDGSLVQVFKEHKIIRNMLQNWKNSFQPVFILKVDQLLSGGETWPGCNLGNMKNARICCCAC
jgi:hypothetical protein